MSLTFTGSVPIPSAQSTPLSILVTGASRGIGLELVKQYAQAHTKNIVFAAVRDPSSAIEVSAFASTHKNVNIIPLDVGSESSIRSSVKHVSALTDHLDVLINNAGVLGGNDPSTVSGDEISHIFNINTIGPLLVIQAYLPLLQTKTGHSPSSVISISTSLGSNQHAYIFNSPFISYGASKAALNYINTVLKHVFTHIVFLAFHPGWVDTDMGNEASNGKVKPPTTVNDTATATRYYIQKKTLENSGEYLDVPTGQLIPY